MLPPRWLALLQICTRTGKQGYDDTCRCVTRKHMHKQDMRHLLKTNKHTHARRGAEERDYCSCCLLVCAKSVVATAELTLRMCCLLPATTPAHTDRQSGSQESRHTVNITTKQL